MSIIPAHPKIYHITHLRNLPQIVESSVLWSDAKRIELALDCDVVGMSHIKKRRLEELRVSCHPATFVGHYAPFYFCPRSIMLYILDRGNHPDLNYREGQQPIVHLEADLHAVVKWADQNNRRWAFSTRNAGAKYVDFYKTTRRLGELNWDAIQANRWSAPEIKDAKQAEFLLHESFPWELVERVGVYNPAAQAKATKAITISDHCPKVVVKRDWYY